MINIFDGSLLKNGRELAIIPSDIIEQDNYKNIFDEKNYEVFSTDSGKALRTRKTFNSYFSRNFS